MGKQNLTSWFFESGFVGIPKNLIGLMEPLGLSFEDLGKILYLLYCGTENIKKNDKYAQEAVKTLLRKNLINWYPEAEKVDFSPLFDNVARNLGDLPVYINETSATATKDLSYSEFIKKLEKKLGRFLSPKEKVELQKVVQRYNWSYELVYDMYLFHQSNFRRQYVFSFFAQMAFAAKVEDKESLARFIENLNYTIYKVTEIKRRLGHKNNPTEIEKECYLKWANEWKFSHEMILKAVELTIYATDPSFKYLDTILENWYKEGIDTTDKLIKYLEKRKKERKNKKISRIGEDVYETVRDLDYLVE